MENLFYLAYFLPENDLGYFDYFSPNILYTCTLLSDIDECVEGTHDCQEKAYCTNHDGSFNCTCNSGYMGNGTSCQGKCYMLVAMETLSHDTWF